MKWIGQHIWSLLSRFRSKVYLEDVDNAGSDTDAFLVKKSDGEVALRTGAEVLSDIGGGSGSVSFDGSTANGVLTYKDADEATVESNLTYDGSELKLQSSTADKPLITVKNTTDDDQGCQLIFDKLRADDGVATGQNLGEIWFRGQDSAQNTQTYSHIISEIDVSTSGQESGKLNLGVCSHNGTNQTVFILTGCSVAGEVDVTIGRQATSVTTVVGDLTVNGDTTTFSSANANDPILIIENTTDDAESGRIRFNTSRGADGQDGDHLGAIEFWGYDDGTPSNLQYGKILTEIHDATDGQESGEMQLRVASHDGELQPGVVITGGSVEDEVDVTIGNGSASLTTINGKLQAEKVRTSGAVHMTHHNFSDNIGTTKHYIGLARGDSENVNSSNIHTPLVFPTPAKLLKLYLRANQDLSGKELTFTLETQAVGVGFGTGPTTVGTIASAGCTGTSITTYDFTDPDSGSNIVNAGEAAYLGIEPDSSIGTTKYYITCIWEVDFAAIP